MSPPSPPPILRLAPGLQSYDWGKLGSSSLAAQFAERCLANEQFQAVDTKPYAELWMGTHPNVPSRVITRSNQDDASSSLLSSHVRAHPDFYLGSKITSRYPSSASDGSLPFLFKILSIRKALSIQAHPDKQLAERLHKERGDVYKGEPKEAGDDMDGGEGDEEARELLLLCRANSDGDADGRRLRSCCRGFRGESRPCRHHPLSTRISAGLPCRLRM